MQLDRDILQLFSDSQLAGRTVEVNWLKECRLYTLERLLSDQGKTSITWKVKDNFERDFALKFVLQRDYATHSLDAEMRRASLLPSELFATISFFGEPRIEGLQISENSFYAVLVDWIDGQTLKSFLFDPTTEVSAETFVRLARDLCSVLQSLKANKLVHNDLHNENILVRISKDALDLTETSRLIVVDTGTLKSEARLHELVETWEQEVAILDSLLEPNKEVTDKSVAIRRWINWFGRTDQEQAVSHLCDTYNAMRRSLPIADPSTIRFLDALPESLLRMVDHDPSRRLIDPRRMYEEIDRVLQESLRPDSPSSGMPSPFDLPSAELIRSDRQLMSIFSEEYPRLDLCRSDAPVYLYGPRGCGKSTILRSMSLKAVLSSDDPEAELNKTPFVGIYISSSQELRSRFWLMKPEDFDALEGHVVRYFNLLLVDSLVDTLDCMFKWDTNSSSRLKFGISDIVASKAAEVLRTRLGLSGDSTRYAGTSHFAAIRQQLRQDRDELWLRILDRDEPKTRADAQVIFDICREMECVIPFLKVHRLCFLIDDYSKQRIPAALQRRLNQVITFSKQATPIFKVTSEYDGVDLDGIQQPREVTEINVGYEYVSFENDLDRYRFLRSVLELRFKYVSGGKEIDLLQFLPPSGLLPAIPLAKEIARIHTEKGRFYYHGLDTLSDVCSGDFAMGIDLIRRIFEDAKMNWKDSPTPIAATYQNNAIREYAKQEYEFIRYLSGDGRKNHEFADSIGWLSRQCVTTKTSSNNGPVVKNHIDISEKALQDLENSPHHSYAKAFLDGLVGRGILFPLAASRSRVGNVPTRRFMLRRILLAKHSTALGRHTPIKIDDVQRLLFFLQEPREFAADELRRTGSSDDLDDPGQLQFVWGD